MRYGSQCYKCRSCNIVFRYASKLCIEENDYAQAPHDVNIGGKRNDMINTRHPFRRAFNSGFFLTHEKHNPTQGSHSTRTRTRADSVVPYIDSDIHVYRRVWINTKATHLSLVALQKEKKKCSTQPLLSPLSSFYIAINGAEIFLSIRRPPTQGCHQADVH